MTCPITRKEDTEKVTKTPKQLIPCILVGGGVSISSGLVHMWGGKWSKRLTDKLVQDVQ